MENPGNSLSPSTLLCQESDSFLYECVDSYTNSNPCSVSESDDEYIQTLLRKESTISIESVQSESWLKCARFDAINWIINARTFFGFQCTTIFLSLTYFDRFLSRQSIDIGKTWAVRLLSIACLSLAAKMEELKQPELPQYCTDDGYNFESNVVRKMELLVLSTMEWKMCSITPFDYLHYFITNLGLVSRDFRRKELVCAAIELILDIPRVINLMDFRASVIALAAVLAASEDQLTKNEMESKMSIISSWDFLKKEDIYSCYNLMQEIKKQKAKTPSKDVTEISSISSVGGSKRRLTYNISDQHCPPNKKQH